MTDPLTNRSTDRLTNRLTNRLTGQLTDRKKCANYLLTLAVLVNGPDCGDVGGGELGQGVAGATSPTTDETRLPNARVANDNTLDNVKVLSHLFHEHQVELPH